MTMGPMEGGLNLGLKATGIGLHCGKGTGSLSEKLDMEGEPAESHAPGLRSALLVPGWTEDLGQVMGTTKSLHFLICK